MSTKSNLWRQIHPNPTENLDGVLTLLIRFFYWRSSIIVEFIFSLKRKKQEVNVYRTELKESEKSMNYPADSNTDHPFKSTISLTL